MKVNNARTVRGHKVYSIKKSRFATFLIIVVLLVISVVLLYQNHIQFNYIGHYDVKDFYSDHLLMYFEVESDQGVPWYYLAAVDKAEELPTEEVSKGRSLMIALHLTGIKDGDSPDSYLAGYNNDRSFFKQLKKEIQKLSHIKDIYENKAFPIDIDYEYGFLDGYGGARSYGGDRKHEGIDIMCEMGVPVISVGKGTVEQVGWLELGGWRLGIRGNDGVYYYYAHLSKYEGKPKKGDKIEKGQVIGYIGDSGYGEIGTTGKFAPHLHFGMYSGKGRSLEAFNPYPFLKAWEQQ